MHFIETRSLNLSLALHASVLLLALFGLPALLPKPSEPMPLVMTVDILPVGEITNVKPSEKPIIKEQKAPTPKTVKPVTPSATEKPTPPAPAEEKPFDPMEDAEPTPDAKPLPKEEKKDASKPKPEEFEALLNKLKQEAKTDKSKDAKDKTNTEANTTRSDAPYDASMPLSISEKDMIRSQFLQCWTMPAGAKNAHTLAARIKVTLQHDGAVLTATLATDQMGRYATDSFFRAAADSAIRAVHKCSPLKNLPADKYGSWREMELNFDPQDLL